MNALLTINGLNAFYGASQILHGISLDIQPGEQIAMIGRNGMGKTTLLRALIGLVDDRKGSVHFHGVDITNARPELIATSGVAIVPEGRGVFASLNVIENLIMAARPGRNGKSAWTLERIFELFPRLNQRRDNGGHQLSGGEQQMLSIGRALMTNPDLLLIDEATEGLAPMVAQDIWRTLEVIRSEGIATIVVDKDIASLSRVADRVIVMSKGQLVFEGTPKALQAAPEILERFLGV
jgi:branched-chain amino acid transport system ATP-binding protein